ncbi:MAG TPA: hypothetical protein VHY91_25495 [Pirellulales bacterium]|jgi:hypothetical protein|nr:hypothetical protein [Pirellulales bacterium]
MRTAWLFSLVAAAIFLIGQAAEAQSLVKPNSASAAPAPAPATAPAPSGSQTAAQDMAARPDAARYYWQNGQWWYYTPQNTWLRWNGAIWVQHVNPSYVPPQPLQVRSFRANDYEPISPPSYRYSINIHRAGL